MKAFENTKLENTCQHSRMSLFVVYAGDGSNVCPKRISVFARFIVGTWKNDSVNASLLTGFCKTKTGLFENAFVWVTPQSLTPTTFV